MQKKAWYKPLLRELSVAMTEKWKKGGCWCDCRKKGHWRWVPS